MQFMLTIRTIDIEKLHKKCHSIECDDGQTYSMGNMCQGPGFTKEMQLKLKLYECKNIQVNEKRNKSNQGRIVV